MRKIFLALLAVAALASPAYAADMPTKAPAYAPPVMASWAGFYIGLQAGYGWFDPTYTFVGASAVSFDTKGFVGGGTVGYNWQTGPLVLGVEGDISFADVKGSILTTAAPCSLDGCTAKLDWFGTGRLRAGYAMGDWMPYVTGGAAVGHVKGSADTLACFPATTCVFGQTRWGWTVGGGLEYRFARNWSAKVEYLYMNLGSPSFNVGTVTADDFAYNIVRGGVNFRF
ncbi:MAG: outer membrane protein [Pseudolabrys sp.]|jgi:outer membrane immunogenic protein